MRKVVRRTQARDQNEYELGVRFHDIREGLSTIPQIQVVDLQAGDFSSKDFRDHFPSVEFVLRESATMEEAWSHLIASFGDYAAYSRYRIVPERMEEVFGQGYWAVVQSTSLEYRRFGVYPVKELGFRIIATIPRGLMSEEEEDTWWVRVVEGLQGIGARFEAGFIPPPAPESFFLPEMLAIPGKHMKSAPGMKFIDEEEGTIEVEPSPSGIDFKPLRAILIEVVQRDPDITLRYLQEPGPNMTVLDLVQLVDAEIASSPKGSWVRRIQKPNFYWGFDAEGLIQIVERPATRIFGQVP